MFKSKKSSFFKQIKSPGSQFPSISVSSSVSVLPKPAEKDIIRDSPKEKPYSKTRSTSILTNTLNTAPITPQNTSSLTKHFQFKFDVNSPLLSQITEKRNPKSKAKRNLKNSEPLFLSQKKSLDSSINELKEIYDSFGLTKKVFTLFEEFFRDLITKDKKFGHLLITVKEIYDEWVAKNTNNNEYITLKNESAALKEDLEKKTEDIKTLTKKVTILCKENYTLGKNIETLQEDYNRLMDKMKSISEVDLDSIPMNQETWKALVTGNMEYSKLFSEMNKKMRDFANRERVYKIVLKKLEESGVKIEPYLKSLETADDGSESDECSFKNDFNDPLEKALLSEDFNKIEPSSISAFSVDSSINFNQ